MKFLLRYRQSMTGKYVFIFRGEIDLKRTSIIVLLAVLSICSLFIGSKSITPVNLLEQDLLSLQVFFLGRIPRLIAVVISGTAMAVAGLIMQQLSRNKYVSPQTGATIYSAQFGVIFAMIFLPKATVYAKTLAAFVCAIAGTVLFMYLVQRIRFKDVIFVPLVGMMFGGIISSATQFLAYKYDMVQNASDWLQGDFSLILKGNYESLYLCIPCLLIAVVYANHYNIAGLGDDFAKSLGIHYKTVLYSGLAVVSILTASVVVTVGTIPFVGLIVPNVVSLYKGDRIKGTLMDNALLGSLFVLACDVLGRLFIYPYEIPIGLTVGVIGSALFLTVMLRGGRRYGKA